MYLASQEAVKVSGRRQPKSTGIVPGSRVTLRAEALDRSRPHLIAHAMHGDIGTVIEATRAGWPGWIHVRFEKCPTLHRLTEAEISPAPGPKR
ncbi:MAG: hypothetical protein WEC75_13650 [Dehalococcoidia bacterium]